MMRRSQEENGVRQADTEHISHSRVIHCFFKSDIRPSHSFTYAKVVYTRKVRMLLTSEKDRA